MGIEEVFSLRIPHFYLLWGAYLQHKALKGVFLADSLPEKLQPLHLEWTLRKIAAQCPAGTRTDAEQRRTSSSLQAYFGSKLWSTPSQGRPQMDTCDFVLLENVYEYRAPREVCKGCSVAASLTNV